MNTTAKQQIDEVGSVIAVEIDRAAVEGTGVGDEPTGILNQAGVGVVLGGVNGAAPTQANIVDLESAVSVPNALIGRLVYVTNADAVGKLKQTLLDAGSGRFLLEGNMTNDRQSLLMSAHWTHLSNSVPNDLTKGTGTNLSAIIFGNWSDLIIGEWDGLDLQVNPYNLDTTGQVPIMSFHPLISRSDTRRASPS